MPPFKEEDIELDEKYLWQNVFLNPVGFFPAFHFFPAFACGAIQIKSLQDFLIMPPFR
jgi:hypothetical protein